MTPKPTILSTIPLDTFLLNRAMDSGVLLDIASFIKVESCSHEPATAAEIAAVCQQPAIVVFTSANAVAAVCDSPAFKNPGWKIFCIERATKKAVLHYFKEEDILGSADNSEELALTIKNAPGVHEVVFFCGDKRMDTLPSTLLVSGIITKEVIVYRTLEQAQFVEKDYDAILFYSPSGVSSFFSMNALSPHTILFAIGNTTADALRLETTNKIIVSDTPSKEILLYKAISYFKENN
jgi:uroporphyrinogen-III synthase